MLLDAEIINKKHFFLLYFTTEDMKFLKMEKKKKDSLLSTRYTTQLNNIIAHTK